MLNPENFKNQWNQFKGVIQESFDELTAEDIAAINGKREVLISKIQSRYGVSKDEAEEQLTEIEETVLPTSTNSTGVRGVKTGTTDTSKGSSSHKKGTRGV